MEPLAHEGLARLLQIGDSLQTPHVVSREGIRDEYAATEPPRELKEPE